MNSFSHRIAIMDQGQIIACGTHSELVKLVGEQARIDLTDLASGPYVAIAVDVEGKVHHCPFIKQ